MSEGLTYDKLLETFRSVPKAPPEFRVFEVPLYAVKVQARVHPRKKRRLQKKWLKRYGYRTEYRRHFEPGQMLVDKSHGVAYAHREEIAAMKRQFPETRLGSYIATSFGERMDFQPFASKPDPRA